ncbi:phosphatidylcholine and lysophosphatidylcholine phospholipase [Exophiala xenobiotica]|uniref:Lysophospholipase NTE1 n=1 Tax=Vermiconidia calcicola TaxID=1690605 RepID=A0AAV9QHF3_9PEZI|nr:phosphatidylcholine and lysophosphatidylcholine phospholipase [Exophiala xenobiotica]KAK5540914.1 phosphatidylcholine and lysophosphatidylcholine phospholipase [Vermiconidia calcicola]KAK5549595.1 phosphatidylcholine and lysophosphatidylcholine phospholipase [Chaetothyriales sp. CCFEE 6169]KAK5223002.1 phosphatidylcholine and lysophosphatidylcholine phospholipase [Exophiala xenobiotica]KAK5267027.1 phosphatidylcholine and lysophosphatidylcholine phospholipase [Exophiala xenobiotica]
MSSSAISATSSMAAHASSSLPTLSPSMSSVAQQVERGQSPSGFGHALLAVASFIPGALFWIITFTTITLPTWLFTLFSMSLTFTMNFTTLLLIVLAIVSTISWFIRYRFLNVYTRLPQEPQRKEAQIDLFPDTQEGDSKPGLSNYLDEFLSAIKVFGYLERPVFHELTRTMQTRKLIAGETLLLEEEKGFCLVVDGLVQIFVKSLRDASDDSPAQVDLFSDDEGYHEGNQGYQLLTEVKNGASMSSLFSILSLFTEDIKLRHGDHGPVAPGFPHHTAQTPGSSIGSPTSQPSTPAVGPGPLEETHRRRLPNVPPLTLDPGFNEREYQTTEAKSRKAVSAHPDIVARATVDTTIAIIPASAFRRLTRVYPKATAHIVQVILTRLHRVTLSTAHQYLGLTSEVLQVEKSMNKFTSFDLPNHLRGAPLDRLRDKFNKERDRIGPEELTKGIALHNPSANRRRSSSGLRREAAIAAGAAAGRGSPLAMTTSAARPAIGDKNVSSGDLHGTAGPSQRPMSMHIRSTSNWTGMGAPDTPRSDITSPMGNREQGYFSPFASDKPHRQDSVQEDGLFRESVLECMSKALGLNDSISQSLKRGPVSVEQSPRLVSYDARRQTAIFNNAFGFIDPYDDLADGDTDSVSTSIASSVNGTGLHGRSLHDELIDDVEIVFFPKGSVLVEQGERNPGLYYVIDGFLDVSIPVEEKEEKNVPYASRVNKNARDEPFPRLRRTKTSGSRASSLPGGPGQSKEGRRTVQKSLFLVKPGGIAGYIGTLSSYRSFTDVTAKTDVYVGFLPRASLERAAEKYPIVLLTMAKRLTSLLPRLILHIDFALEWVQVDAGQVIHHQGDDSDAIYIVLNGRLRAVREAEGGNMRVAGEYGQGESIGELEVMTDASRPATLHAIRETELAKIPRSLFNSLAQEHPTITIQISKLIAQRMRALVEAPLTDKGQERSKAALGESTTSNFNLRTIAVLPVTTGVPVIEFGNRLMAALSQVGVPNGVSLLNQAIILNHLGRHAFSRMGRLKLSQYLADLEEKYGMLLYIADTSVNAPWTQTCISQADCILLVGLAESSPSIGEYERFLLGMKTTARKELVLLHVERYSRPGLTRRWLRDRMWINGGHHHVQMAFRVSPEATPHAQPRRLGTAIKQRVQVIQAEIQKYTSRRVRQAPLYSADTPFKGDFHRLARRLCGKSVGLVLGGGGARGIAHVGVIRALEEAGIPIDIIGGTSIGAFMGALYARDADVVPMFGRAKQFAGRMGSMWRFALDLTYPSASYTTGHEFNRGLFKIFGDSQIEDFWLSFYCNTTNISKSRAEIHTSGYAWRYVRASMSLAGLIPPICDDGSMLLDGGYMDNLTVAHMKSLGADLVFAVDVGSQDDDTPQQYGDTLSGFWALLNRWNPFSSIPNPPTLNDIQARLAYVSSVDALERAKNTPGCVYMRPPIDAYGTLQFGSFSEIVEIGYSYAKEYLLRLKNEGELDGVIDAWAAGDDEKGKQLLRAMAPRRASV